MKTLLLSFLLSLFISCSFAQKITGKWTCDKEVMHVLRMDFEDMYFTYKFKKNGTFRIVIKGETGAYLDKKMGIIKITGKYNIKDGKIASFVDNKEIETSALYMRDENRLLEEKVSYQKSFYEYQNEYEKKTVEELLRKIMEHRYLWDWDNEPITITKNELVIGEKLKCRR